MRILYFYQYFTSPKGSWGTRVYEMARRWTKQGDKVTVITSVYDKSDLIPDGIVSRFNIEGIDVRVINVRLSNKHGKWMRMLTFALFSGISSLFALFAKADVVVASSGPITVGIPGLIARYLRRRPFVFEVRDIWPEGAVQLGVIRNRWMIRVARMLEKACYRAAHTVVALSPGMAEWIRTTYGFENLDVVTNASDNQLMATRDPKKDLPEWAQGKHLVLYTGTLGLMDNCRQIVDMATTLQERGLDQFAVAMIGDGKERPELEALVHERGLTNIHFVGLLPKTEVFSYLKAGFAAVVCFKNVPALNTVSPNKMFDAFSAGLPVIQNTNGWIQGLFEKEQCGVNVGYDDPEGMANALVKLESEPTFYETCSRNARRLANERFDRTIQSDKMRAIIHAAGNR